MNIWRGIISLALSLATLLLYVDMAFAGPGGFIKDAARTPLGRIIMGVLVAIFLPILLYFGIKRAIWVARTKRDLATLTKAYPGMYHWQEVDSRVREVYTWLWTSWSPEKIERAEEFATIWYWRNQQLLLEEWQSHGLENVTRLSGIRSVTPIYVEHRSLECKDGEGSILVVNITGNATDYMRETATDKVVEGDKKTAEVDAVWTFLWENGAWRVNKIEKGDVEYAYLFEPNKLPATLPDTVSVKP
ncbi:MAG: hypothetical protein H8F28_05065 [Fibrella sp.]|nr:hypothetical protein [Armatimonadota bacterium]